MIIGHAPRLGQFGFQKNNDAVEGVILMRRGEQTQTVLKAVQAKTDELNASSRRQDSSVLRPQRSGEAHDGHRGGKPAPRDGAVLIVLIFFLVSFRAAVIVALTIPLSLLFAFIVLHAHDVAANLLSIGAIVR